MSLDEAIQQMSDKIKTACPGAEIKSVKMSEEEARLSVYAPAAEIQKINRRKADVIYSAIDESGGFDRLDGERQSSSFDARKIEDIVDQEHEMAPGLIDLLHGGELPVCQRDGSA